MAKYDGSITIGVDIDEKDAASGLDDLQKEIGDVGDALEDAEGASLSFGDVLKANVISETIITGVKKLADALGSFVKGSVSTAAELTAEASQFEQTFGDMGSAAEVAIGRVADEAGIVDTRLKQLGSQIYAFARATGGDTTESMELMETALQAAADAAAYYDRSLEDTVGTLQSFLKGNFENDAALGLSCTETTRNAAAMELFGQKYADLTEIQKQQTLLQMVVDAQALSGAMGQASRESDGLENVMGNLSEVARQIQGNIGAPVLEAALPVIQEITASLLEWSESVDWTAFGNAVGGFLNYVVENGPAILSVIAGVAAGFLAWNVVTMIQGVISAIQAFKVANEGASIAQLALNAAMNANPIGLIITIVSALVAALVTLWATSEDFRDAVTAIWEKIKTVAVGAWEAIKATFAPVVATLSGYFSDAWKSIKAIFGGIIDFVTGVFTGDWERAWEGIKNIFLGAWNGIAGILENAVNLIIKGINWLISKLNLISFDIPDWVPSIGGKSFGINVPEIPEFSLPRLAQGAVIPANREFLAVLGDQKSGVNIEAPLETIVKAFKQATNETGAFTADITVNLDGEVVWKNQQRVAGRHGKALVGGGW